MLLKETIIISKKILFNQLCVKLFNKVTNPIMTRKANLLSVEDYIEDHQNGPHNIISKCNIPSTELSIVGDIHEGREEYNS